MKKIFNSETGRFDWINDAFDPATIPDYAWSKTTAQTGLTGDKTGSFNLSTTGTLGAGAITGTSFIIGANTLNTTEWAFLDGQDQALKTTNSPTFANLTVTTQTNANLYDKANTWDNNQPSPNNSTTVLATTKYSTSYWPHYATDLTASLVGAYSGATSWISGAGVVTEQRFHIDVGSAKVVNRIYYENLHNSGSSTTGGVKTFTFWGSNTVGDFNDTVYANDGTWVQLSTSQGTFDQHIAVDTTDAKFITVTNATAYRYYAFKFADNWTSASSMGVRRIGLQTASGDYGLSVDAQNRKLIKQDGSTVADWSLPSNRFYVSSTAYLTTAPVNYNARVVTTGGYLDFGPASSSYCHFYTDRATYYFNKPITTVGNIFPYTDDTYTLGDATHGWDKIYMTTGLILPTVDSTTALAFANAAGTAILNVDTTNSRVGIGTTAPAKLLSVGANLWQADVNGIEWNNGAITTTNGVTGTAKWSQPFQGSAYKKVVINLANFTSAGTVLTFPTAFINVPYTYGDAAVVAIAVTTATTCTLTSVGAVAGNLIIEGY